MLAADLTSLIEPTVRHLLCRLASPGSSGQPVPVENGGRQSQGQRIIHALTVE